MFSERDALMEKLKRVSIILFLSVLILPSLSWGIIKAVDLCGLNLSEKLEYDVGEKREKSEISAEVTAVSASVQLENYYNDRVPFRSAIITANKKLTSSVEKPFNNYLEKKYALSDEMLLAETIGNDTGNPEEEQDKEDGQESFWDRFTKSETEETIEPEQIAEITETDDIGEVTEVSDEPSGENTFIDEVEEVADEENPEESDEDEEQPVVEAQTSELPFRVVGENVVPGTDGWLFFGDSRNIDTFSRTNLKDEGELANYATSFISLKTDCDLAGKELRCFICPEKETIYSEYYPKLERQADISLATQICNYMSVNSSVQMIYPKEELMRNKNKYQLYYKHDTHWNASGGYIGTAELLISLGIPVPSLDSIYTRPVTITSGDLVLLGGLDTAEYETDTNYDVGYMNHVGVFCDQSFFSDVNRIDITSQSENHKMLVLVGDSCKMHMLPYLSTNFDHVVFIHKNAVTNESSKETIRQADVIVLETAERSLGEFSFTAWNVHAALAKTGEQQD